MNVAVLHVNTASAKSTSPTMRIARFVADTLQLPLVHNEATGDEMLTRMPTIDILFVKYGMLAFSQHRKQALELYRRARRIINLENDYTFMPDSRFTKANPVYEVWSTMPLNAAKFGGRYINWNQLTFLPANAWAQPLPFVEPAHPDTLLYYGAFRENRRSSFLKYFKEPQVPVVISSYRGGPLFRTLNPQLTTIPAFRRPEHVQRYAATLYIEDDYSYREFTSPANRFYECLQLGVAQLFDANAIPNLSVAGFDARDFEVRTPDDVARMLPQWDDIRISQRERWHRDFGKELRDEVLNAWNSL